VLEPITRNSKGAGPWMNPFSIFVKVKFWSWEVSWISEGIQTSSKKQNMDCMATSLTRLCSTIIGVNLQTWTTICWYIYIIYIYIHVRIHIHILRCSDRVHNIFYFNTMCIYLIVCACLLYRYIMCAYATMQLCMYVLLMTSSGYNWIYKHYITLHYITLHCILLHLHYILLHLHLHYIAIHVITLHHDTLHFITFTLHYILLHLHYMTLHYITLHYNTLHTYIHTLPWEPMCNYVCYTDRLTRTPPPPAQPEVQKG
jgi:hypothetical protein